MQIRKWERRAHDVVVVGLMLHRSFCVRVKTLFVVWCLSYNTFFMRRGATFLRGGVVRRVLTWPNVVV